MTTRLTNTNLLFTFQFLVTSSGTPEQLSVKRRATTIAFVENDASADTITDSSSLFLVTGFQAGDQITVSGSASNDGTYVIASVTAGTITLLARNDLTTESAGATVNIKAKKANSGDITVGYSSATALNTGTGWVSLDANESLGVQVENINAIWLDATTTGEGVEVWFEKNVQA